MIKLFLATKNKGKIKEIKEILHDIKGIEFHSFIDSHDIPDVEEDGDTFEANSIKKALEITKYLKDFYVMSDDSGLEVDALNKEPGVYSARYAGEHSDDEKNNEKLLKNIKGKKDRTGRYVAVVTIAKPDLTYYTFRGEIEGEIIDELRGNKGFGYDPMFYLKEYGKTFGELDGDIKNKISHRAVALEKFKKEIKNIFGIDGGIK